MKGHFKRYSRRSISSQGSQASTPASVVETPVSSVGGFTPRGALSPQARLELQPPWDRLFAEQCVAQRLSVQDFVILWQAALLEEDSRLGAPVSKDVIEQIFQVVFLAPKTGSISREDFLLRAPGLWYCRADLSAVPSQILAVDPTVISLLFPQRLRPVPKRMLPALYGKFRSAGGGAQQFAKLCASVNREYRCEGAPQEDVLEAYNAIMLAGCKDGRLEESAFTLRFNAVWQRQGDLSSLTRMVRAASALLLAAPKEAGVSEEEELPERCTPTKAPEQDQSSLVERVRTSLSAGAEAVGETAGQVVRSLGGRDDSFVERVRSSFSAGSEAVGEAVGGLAGDIADGVAGLLQRDADKAHNGEVRVRASLRPFERDGRERLRARRRPSGTSQPSKQEVVPRTRSQEPRLVGGAKDSSVSEEDSSSETAPKSKAKSKAKTMKKKASSSSSSADDAPTREFRSKAKAQSKRKTQKAVKASRKEESSSSEDEELAARKARSKAKAKAKLAKKAKAQTDSSSSEDYKRKRAKSKAGLKAKSAGLEDEDTSPERPNPPDPWESMGSDSEDSLPGRSTQRSTYAAARQFQREKGSHVNDKTKRENRIREKQAEVKPRPRADSGDSLPSDPGFSPKEVAAVEADELPEDTGTWGTSTQLRFTQWPGTTNWADSLDFDDNPGRATAANMRQLAANHPGSGALTAEEAQERRLVALLQGPFGAPRPLDEGLGHTIPPSTFTESSRLKHEVSVAPLAMPSEAVPSVRATVASLGQEDWSSAGFGRLDKDPKVFQELLCITEEPPLYWVADEMMATLLPPGIQPLDPNSRDPLVLEALQRCAPDAPPILYVDLSSGLKPEVLLRHPYQEVFEQIVALASLLPRSAEPLVLIEAAQEASTQEYSLAVTAWREDRTVEGHPGFVNSQTGERRSTDPRQHLLRELQLTCRIMAMLRARVRASIAGGRGNY